MLIITCFDNFSRVRIKSCKYLSKVITLILEGDNEDLKNNCINIIKSFVFCRHFNFRQLSLMVMWKIFNSENTFMKIPELTEFLTALTFDKIESVRIALGKFFKEKEPKAPWFKENKKILGIIKVLQKDKSPIVKEYVDKINTNECEEIGEEQFKDINELFTGEMEFIKDNLGFNPILQLGNNKWVQK